MTNPLDGVLVVDKPVGPTSHDVVARVRRTCRGTRVGHTGTLDPMASGVLALVMGRATRLARFLSASDKSYDATVRLGIETDTYDAEGLVLARAWHDTAGASSVPAASSVRVESAFRRISAGAANPAEAGSHEIDAGAGQTVVPSAADVERVLDRFRGRYEQLPPPFSAKKVAGTRAYELARQQRPVALTPAAVSVDVLELVACEGDLVRLTVTCSAGFYVRVLAHELGRALGCGAHLAGLRRTRSGEFGLDTALPLEGVESGPEAVAGALVPLDAMLPQSCAARLTERGAARTRQGRMLEADDIDAWIREESPGSAPGPVRLFDPEGHLLAIAARHEAFAPLHPGIVLV